jgi:hypothetical protein
VPCSALYFTSSPWWSDRDVTCIHDALALFTAQIQSGAQGQLWTANIQGIGNVAVKQFSMNSLASAQTEIQAVSE